MSLAITYSRARSGINAPLVTVETHLSNGLPAFNIVGLAETAVKESKDRVRSALLNCHFEFPARRITVNLAPADLPKEGGRFDLAIALGILLASKQLQTDQINRWEFLGELGLTGALRPVNGSLPAAIAAAADQRQLVVASGNGSEVALSGYAGLHTANTLLEVCAHLRGKQPLPRPAPAGPGQESAPDYPDLSDVRGQAPAKRGLEIAAAGGHNLLFFGPPGTGKTMLASRLPGLLPPLAEDEMLQVATVYSLVNQQRCYQRQHPARRPFRQPHHSASAAALVGGGSQPKPGEISFAHCGVLFLDELPEFQRSVLELLREPLEHGEIVISRAREQVVFPARFQLIAAMNPCPCGYHGDRQRHCRCSPDQISRYQQKISGPLLDRIDLHIPVERLPANLLMAQPEGETSAVIRARVMAARDCQLQRQGKVNGQLAATELGEYCALGRRSEQWLQGVITRLQLSPRAYHRSLRVARTLADLQGRADISDQDLQEALGYRQLMTF